VWPTANPRVHLLYGVAAAAAAATAVDAIAVVTFIALSQQNSRPPASDIEFLGSLSAKNVLLFVFFFFFSFLHYNRKM